VRASRYLEVAARLLPRWFTGACCLDELRTPAEPRGQPPHKPARYILHTKQPNPGLFNAHTQAEAALTRGSCVQTSACQACTFLASSVCLVAAQVADRRLLPGWQMTACQPLGQQTLPKVRLEVVLIYITDAQHLSAGLCSIHTAESSIDQALRLLCTNT
jgi:hypothetical protein